MKKVDIVKFPTLLSGSPVTRSEISKKLLQQIKDLFKENHVSITSIASIPCHSNLLISLTLSFFCLRRIFYLHYRSDHLSTKMQSISTVLWLARRGWELILMYTIHKIWEDYLVSFDLPMLAYLNDSVLSSP